MEKSFTVLELLLTTIVIMVLVALMLPSFGKAKFQAQKVACSVAVRSYMVGFSDQGRLVFVIPQEANCFQCHQLP